MALIFFGTLSVSPASGGVGTTLTIDNTGSGFFGTMVVTVGGVAADNIAVDTGHGNGQQRITCDIAAGTPTGAQDIYVESPDGENATLSGAVTVASAGGQHRSLALSLGIGIGI